MNNKRAQITRLAAGLLALAMTLTLATSLWLPVRAAPLEQSSSTSVFINEIHYDNASTDAGEAIEIAGPAGTDLTGWSIALYNGSPTQLNVYDTITLSGVIPDQQNGFGTLSFSRAGIQNGSPDGMALVDSSSAVVQFLSYEGSFTAVGGPANGMVSTDIGVTEGSSTPVGDSLQLVGTGAVYEDFTWSAPAANTFGAVNTGQTFGGGGEPDLVINEIDYDQPSTDTAEFVEVKNVGTSAVDLTGVDLVLVNGTGGGAAVYNTVALPAVSLAAGDYFVVCANATTVANCDLDASPDTNFIQNGAPDAVALVQDSTVIDTVSYEGDTGAPYTEGSGSGLEDSSSTPDMGISRCPDGTDTDQNNADLKLVEITPGAANICETCDDPFTAIYTVQGSGSASPIKDSVVSVEGVVVGDFQGSDELDGFFLQDASGDGDPATSDGIFVYAPGTTDVVEGELVRVRGTVNEYNELTEIGYVELLLSCGTGSVGPTEVNLPIPVDLEPYEGMLVTFLETLTASQNYFQGRYGQVTLSAEGRLFNPTNIYTPLSPEAIALADENMRRMIVLDDGMDVSPWGDNPAPIPYIGADNTLRAGDTVAGLTGVIDYGLITTPSDPIYHYRLHPTEEPVSFTRVNERTAAPEGVGGVIKIASFNVLNYFNGDGLGGGFPTSRGANSPEEFTRQRDKIISAIIAMDADVIGLMEIENDGYGPYSAIADLVNGLNDVAGAGTYAFVDPGVAPVGTDEIAVGFIYQPATVTPVGAAAILDSSVDLSFRSDYNRPAIAQTFERSTGGGVFTAVVNHLKSKGSPCDDIGDPDIGDGQGNCNLTRTNAAIALTNWLAEDPTGSGDPDFFIIGDLNAYAMEDPITAIKNADYTNLVKAFVGTEAYSYIFDGQAGYLDHSLASLNAVPQVMGATVWHINTDEPFVIDYNTEYKPEDLYTPTPYRSSDHDPVVVGFCDAVPPLVEVSVTPDTLWPPNHKYVTVQATVDVSDNIDPNPTLTLVSVTSNEPDNGLGDGDTPDDIVIVGDFTFKLRAERSGTGDGRIYTITYQVTDACGNSTIATATVTVPHSRGEGEK